jgi:hypothetical protein
MYNVSKENEECFEKSLDIMAFLFKKSPDSLGFTGSPARLLAAAHHAG